MRNLRLVGVVAGAAALALACSSSTAPKPTVAGVWHVTTGAFGAGTLSPATFDVTVTQVSANSLSVSMPTITWSTFPKVFSGVKNVITFSDSTLFGVSERAQTQANFCDNIGFWGTMNAARDTLLGAKVSVYDTTTMNGTVICIPTTMANVTMTK